MSEFDRETSILRRPWSTEGCCALESKEVVVAVVVVVVVIVVVVVVTVATAAASKMIPSIDSSIENVYIPRDSTHLTLHSVNNGLNFPASIKA